MRTWKIPRTKVFIIIIFMTLIPLFSTAAQEGSFTDTFDNPDLPGWDRMPGVNGHDGVMLIEPENFAALRGEINNFEITVKIRRLGVGDFALTYRGSEVGTSILLVGMEHVAFQREDIRGVVELGAAGINIPFESMIEINLVVSYEEHKVTINGTPVLVVIDPDPLPPGWISIETLGGQTLEIDEIEMTYEGYLPFGPGENLSETRQQPAAQDNSLTWVRTGGPLGGLGYDVRMHPDKLDILFVTDAFAGVFKSEDSGTTWYPSNEGITTRGGTSGDAIPIFCLTIDPNNPDIIWAGTQNTRGIFKSVDSGQTWVERVNGITEREGITFRGITIDPHSSDIVYAAAEISSFIWSNTEQLGREFDKTMGVVYKSNDGGDSWTPIWRGDNLARYIIVDPRDSDVVYVSTGIFDREAANSDSATNTPGGVGVLKSTDGGKTWSQINNGITNLYIGSLFMHPEEPDILIAGAGNNAYMEGSGVFISRDGGENWQKVIDNPVQSVEFAVSDPDIAYAGEPGWIFRSEDGGMNWQTVTENDHGWGPPGVVAGFPIDFQVDPRDPDRLFANNYGGGNFLSEDGGRTWVVASTGYTGAQVREIAVSPKDPAQVYVSARSGFFGSSDGGKNWVGLVLPEAGGLEWNAVDIDPSNPSHLLAANNWMGRVVESQDGGRHWRVTNAVLPEMQGWRVIAFAPSDPDIVYAGTGAFYSAGGFDPNIKASGIFISEDGGTSWQEANNEISQDAHISDLAVDPENPQRVLAASPAFGLLKTEDGGINWDQLGEFSTRSRPLSISIHPTKPDVIYLGMEFGGLSKSEDGGESWYWVEAGIPPEGTFTSIVFNPTDPNMLFASLMEGGVYVSQDGGENWMVINNGLRTRAVNALGISSDGFHLYAATEGEGVFRLDLNGVPPEPAMITAEEQVSEQPVVEDTEEHEEDKSIGEPVGEDPQDEETPLTEVEPVTDRKIPCLGGLLPAILVGLFGVPWLWMKRAA